MNVKNLQKLESYIGSLECPVFHKKLDVKILYNRGRVTVSHSSDLCCPFWGKRISTIVAFETTRIENCELTGTEYEIR